MSRTQVLRHTLAIGYLVAGHATDTHILARLAATETK